MSPDESNPQRRSPQRSTVTAPNLDGEGIVDHGLCHFELLGQLYELRFHPRPDRESPFAIEPAGGGYESKRRYYLRVDARRRVMHAVRGDDVEQNTPFDDLAFRLVYVGEAVPRIEIADGSTRWCSCPRVRGLHPVFFCNRIAIPNWQNYWCWKREQAEPQLRTDLAEAVHRTDAVSTSDAVAQAGVAYPDLTRWQRTNGEPGHGER